MYDLEKYLIDGKSVIPAQLSIEIQGFPNPSKKDLNHRTLSLMTACLRGAQSKAAYNRTSHLLPAFSKALNTAALVDDSAHKDLARKYLEDDILWLISKAGITLPKNFVRQGHKLASEISIGDDITLLSGIRNTCQWLISEWDSVYTNPTTYGILALLFALTHHSSDDARTRANTLVCLLNYYTVSTFD